MRPDAMRPDEPNDKPPSRPYRPSPLLGASIALHAAVLGAGIARPSSLRRTLPWLVANHAVLCAAGAWPRGQLLGPSLTRVPPQLRGARDLSLTFDDGPDPRTTPHVLDLLDRHDARGTFFCIGRRIAEHPDLAAEIVRRGHRVENHTWSHRNTFAFGFPGALRSEIGRAQSLVADVCGRRPAYFRPPAGMRNPFLEMVLAELGLWLVSWSRRGYDAVLRDPEFILRRLCAGAAPGAILLLHDGGLGDGPPPPVLEVLPRLLGALEARDLRSIALPDGLAPAGEIDRPGLFS